MLKTEPDFRLIVSQGSAEYVGRRGPAVLFRDPNTDAVLSLYLDALTPENIYLSCKAAREKFCAIPEWEEVTANEKG
jgi:hypothetical protein